MDDEGVHDFRALVILVGFGAPGWRKGILVLDFNLKVSGFLLLWIWLDGLGRITTLYDLLFLRAEMLEICC